MSVLSCLSLGIVPGSEEKHTVAVTNVGFARMVGAILILALVMGCVLSGVP